MRACICVCVGREGEWVWMSGVISHCYWTKQLLTEGLLSLG